LGRNSNQQPQPQKIHHIKLQNVQHWLVNLKSSKVLVTTGQSWYCNESLPFRTGSRSTEVTAQTQSRLSVQLLSSHVLLPTVGCHVSTLCPTTSHMLSSCWLSHFNRDPKVCASA
jgi:hypothetical protein